ncbi:MAG: response regulator receiver domain [bacterium]|nr:response regulator receiver domain [bacterium]
MSFETVAKSIIKETISSAIFIDDHALENFTTKDEGLKDEQERTIALFNDFKKNQCLLHPFKYNKKGWDDDKMFYLKNKDLLILDWQLEDEQHDDALKILEEAIDVKSLHFICIYTKEAKDTVKNELNRFYRGRAKEEEIAQLRDLISDTDLDDFWSIDDNDSSKEKFDTLINNIVNAKLEDVDQEIHSFCKAYGIDKPLKRKILKTGDSKVDIFYKLRTALLKEQPNFTSFANDVFKTSKDDDYTFYINHTIVKIFTKEQIHGDQLYDAFLESFLGEQNIFLSLMGLEMRNRFREKSAFIGKDFDDLSEEAFFFHKLKNDDHPFIFYDFLREILKDQVASYLHESDLKLYGTLEEYYNKVNGNKRQSAFTSSDSKAVDKFINELFKLNHFYNRVNTDERNEVDFIRFGDIFRITKEEGDDRFFLCVTPHCDCLDPKKIDNQYWFIEGVRVNDSSQSRLKVLDNTDGLFISFVEIEGVIDAIYWENSSHECKPKTFYVENNQVKDGIVGVSFNNKAEQFHLIESLKENYAQRLANRAFGYPLRVGIDFAKKK